MSAELQPHQSSRELTWAMAVGATWGLRPPRKSVPSTQADLQPGQVQSRLRRL